jgi:PKD repeat protein
VAYRWSFGDGRSGSGRLVTHRFSRAGAYKVVLRAVDSWGDWGIYARTIRVSARR